MNDERSTAKDGRLHSRPATPTESATPGLLPLELDAGRDGAIYVPRGYSPERPAPVVVSLHGAGGNARHGLGLLRSLADAWGIVLLAPDARGPTWDVIRGGYGPDVSFIDRALEQLFRRVAVDPDRLAIGGFSDGASYALSLGITNGDLLSHVLAFSPGFVAPGGQRGAPSIYISHGTADPVLPIDPCSRRVVPQLQKAGYDLLYREFEGGHAVPPEIAREAVEWFLGTKES